MTFDIPAAVTSLGNAVAGAFAWVLEKMRLKNTPAMQEAAEAAKEQREQDADNAAIKERDEDRIVDSTS